MKTVNHFYPANSMGAEINTHNGAHKESIMGKMKDMNKLTAILVPCDKWNAARSAASTLARDCGMEYAVMKLARAGDEGEILVTRIR